MFYRFVGLVILVSCAAGQPRVVLNTCCYNGTISSEEMGSVPLRGCTHPVILSINTFPGPTFSVMGQISGNGIVPFSQMMNFDGTARTYQFPVSYCPTSLAATTPTIVFTDRGAAGQQSRTFTMNAMIRQPTKDGDGAKTVADPVSAATGEYYLASPALDLALGGGPLGVLFTRHYASFLRDNGFSGALGANWMHNFEARLVTVASDAIVTRFRGRQIRFRETSGAWNRISPERLNFQLVRTASAWRFYDPERDLIYTFSNTGQLTAITDRAGNAIDVTYTAGTTGPTRVSDGRARTLDLTYTAGKLASVRDQTGRTVRYRYEGDNLVEVTDPDGRKTAYRYTAAGRLTGLKTATVEPLGNAPYSHEYDSEGRVRKQTDSLGNPVTFEYNQATGKTSVTDPAGNAEVLTHSNYNLTATQDAPAPDSRTFDADGRLLSWTAKDSSKSTITYHDPSGFPATITDPLGNVSRYEYVAQSQGGFTFHLPSQITRPDGSLVRFTYDASGNMTRMTDSTGGERLSTFNERGQLLTVTNPAGGVTRLTYNPDGTLASRSFGENTTITYVYDSLKRATTVRYPDGSTRAIAYDNLSRPVSFTDERGKQVQLTYDDNGRVVSVTDEIGNARQRTYDTMNRLAATTNRLGGETKFRYGRTGDIESASQASGLTTSFAVNAQGLTTSATDGLGNVTRFTYDAKGRLASVTDPAGNVSTLRRNAAGNLVQFENGAGGVTEFGYDKMGRRVTAKNGAGVEVSLAYDARGLLTAAALSEGIQISYERNANGLLTGIIDAKGGTWARSYDARGRLVSRTDPLGRAVAWVYNQRGHVESITSADEKALYSHDPAGNLTKIEHSDGTTFSYEYDPRNFLVKAEGIAFDYDAEGFLTNSNGIALTRNPAGQITSIGYGGDRIIRYEYDQNGRVSSIADWLGGVTTLTYTVNGQVAAMVRPNGVKTDYSYDKANRLAGINETREDALSSITLVRDGAGRITSSDKNLPASTAVAPGVSELGFDVAHQLNDHTFDSLGRLTQSPLRQYAWSAGSRLARYEGADGAASFSYDALGNRISRSSADATTNFALNYALALPSVGVVRSADADQRYYVHLPNGTPLYSIEAADNARRFPGTR